uniref:Uncharacterized protein n=1 Tax=Panagrolaimus sp. PS1159 TaxID=55785 RepID=A0AC35GUU3_9BILA
IFKRGYTLLSSSIRTLKWRQVYEIQHKQSINFLLNPVSLITYQRIEDKINPVDYVLNCLCNSVQDVQELQKNPHQLAHLIPNDVNAVLEVCLSLLLIYKFKKYE